MASYSTKTPSVLYNSMYYYVLTPQQQEVNCYPRQGGPNKAIINPQRVSQLQSMPSVKLAHDERICNRCTKVYKVDCNGVSVNRDDSCSYHWGSSYQRRGYKTPYTCCNRDSNSKGCTINKWHVSDIGNLDCSQKEFVNTKGFAGCQDYPKRRAILPSRFVEQEVDFDWARIVRGLESSEDDTRHGN